MKKIISFPHLGNYYIPISKFLTKTTKLKVIPSPPITKKTIEIGSKNSPDTACVPFKYNLGNFIESLENGANVLFTAGGGCRYRYYAEVTEVILKDLGYEFEFYKISSRDKLRLREVYKTFKKINKDLTIWQLLHSILYTFIFIWHMDKIDKLIRKNIGFEEKKNSFILLQKKMLKNFKKTDSITKLTIEYFKYKKLFKKLKVNKPKKPLKVAIIGELYTSMEPFSSYFLEQELASMNIEVTRFTNLSYLLWQKAFLIKHMLRKSKKYCKYKLGADGLDNIYRSILVSEKKYDGIIHIKPFGCTPEVTAIPIIQKICKDYKIPIIFFSFDSETSNEGIKTRLEAFYDLLNIRRDKHE